ncbi:MAG: nitronate monooxygenase [Actinobacteria bacterium]|nr:nitronate monooxygenase [Actinomycetota bacterium]
MPSTELCRALGIEQPILSVGFAAAAGPELAAAVSNAGGLGVVGGSGFPSSYLRERIAATRELTDRPFGINLIIDDQGDPEATAVLHERFSACVDELVPVIVLFEGDPSWYVDAARGRGPKVFIQVGSPAEARAAADAGVDAVIAQGVEAGGHIAARHGLFVNLPAIVDAVAPLPVLASGGIADGRGLAAAIALGAQGVSLGTRFVATDEAFVSDEYKRRVVASGAADTFYSEFLFDVNWPDVPHRAIKTKAYDEWVGAGMPPSGERPGEGETIGALHRPWGELEISRWTSFMATPWFEGDLEFAPLWAGESVELVHEILPAGEVVRRIAAEADEVLARVGRYA